MRIWSLHPSHLDRMGLVACWRETLLAQKVLAGGTQGYRNHPQLERFRAQPDPLAAVGAYLGGVAAEARGRGYRFDVARILRPAAVEGESANADAGTDGPTPGPAALDEPPPVPAIPVAVGQLDSEWQHLGRKLQARSPDDAARWKASGPTPHPLFRVVPGGVEPWERP